MTPDRLARQPSREGESERIDTERSAQENDPLSDPSHVGAGEQAHEFKAFPINDPRHYADICRICGDVHGAGLIHQVARPLAETEPRPIRERIIEAAEQAYKTSDFNAPLSVVRHHVVRRVAEGAAREALLIVKESFGVEPYLNKHVEAGYREGQRLIQAILAELTDGNQGATEVSDAAMGAQEHDHGVSLLPGDGLASPTSSEPLPNSELTQIARTAAVTAWRACNGIGPNGSDILHVIADAVAIRIVSALRMRGTLLSHPPDMWEITSDALRELKVGSGTDSLSEASGLNAQERERPDQTSPTGPCFDAPREDRGNPLVNVEAIASFVEHLRDGYQSTAEPVAKVARLIRERFNASWVPPFKPEVVEGMIDDVARDILSVLAEGDGQHTEELDRNLIGANLMAFYQTINGTHASQVGHATQPLSEASAGIPSAAPNDSSSPASALYEALKKARTLIEYARYELQPGKATMGSQFPHQEDADVVTAIIDQALQQYDLRDHSAALLPVDPSAHATTEALPNSLGAATLTTRGAEYGEGLPPHPVVQPLPHASECRCGFCVSDTDASERELAHLSQFERELTLKVRAVMKDAPPFRPCAVFDEQLDCVRVNWRDCSQVEERINQWLTLCYDNYPDGQTRLVGFNLKGVAHAMGVERANEISAGLDAVLATNNADGTLPNNTSNQAGRDDALLNAPSATVSQRFVAILKEINADPEVIAIAERHAVQEIGGGNQATQEQADATGRSEAHKENSTPDCDLRDEARRSEE